MLLQDKLILFKNVIVVRAQILFAGHVVLFIPPVLPSWPCGDGNNYYCILKSNSNELRAN
jgi:hypothetical protein